MISSRESTGLFLGLVTSSFELSSPTYIFSKGFRACFLRLGSLSKMDIATLLLHIYLFILAASAGPSSAIAMLPKLGSWSFPNGFHAVMGETISSREIQIQQSCWAYTSKRSFQKYTRPESRPSSALRLYTIATWPIQRSIHQPAHETLLLAWSTGFQGWPSLTCTTPRNSLACFLQHNGSGWVLLTHSRCRRCFRLWLAEDITSCQSRRRINITAPVAYAM